MTFVLGCALLIVVALVGEELAAWIYHRRR